MYLLFGASRKDWLHVGDCAHEWGMIRYLYRHELKKNPDAALKFMMFMAQFCPEYKWINYDLNDPVASVVLECQMNDLKFKAAESKERRKAGRRVVAQFDLLFLDADKSAPMLFGRMVTDFMIRHLMYSIIGNSKEKIIVTAHNKCGKKFEKYFDKGYSLQRRSKYRYIELSDELKEATNGVDGYFEELPIMPNLDTYYDFNEILVCDNHRVLLKTYLPPKE